MQLNTVQNVSHSVEPFGMVFKSNVIRCGRLSKRVRSLSGNASDCGVVFAPEHAPLIQPIKYIFHMKKAVSPARLRFDVHFGRRFGGVGWTTCRLSRS
jgi:transposase